MQRRNRALYNRDIRSTPHLEVESARGGGKVTATPRGFAVYAWTVLGYNLAVVLWGAFVRATGSGAGCGNRWPLCNGEIAPHSPMLARIIEFTHRATSGVDVALVALLIFLAFRIYPRGHVVPCAAIFSGVFLITEALIGAGLVLLEYVARNASAARAWWDTTHLLNTLTLLACLTLTAWLASGRDAAWPKGRGAWMAWSSLGTMAVLGVSGVIAALGDTLFPVRSLAEGWSRDFDPSANLFVRLRIWHPMMAACVGAGLVCYAVGRAREAGLTRRLAYGAMVLVGLQMVAGMVNLTLLAPVGMQLVHLLLADLLWIWLVLLAATRVRLEKPAS